MKSEIEKKDSELKTAILIEDELRGEIERKDARIVQLLEAQSKIIAQKSKWYDRWVEAENQVEIIKSSLTSVKRGRLIWAIIAGILTGIIIYLLILML